VFGDQAALRQLESIIHPRVKAEGERFLGRARARRKAVVALDIPLLFETGAESRCDAVVVVSAPPFVQLARVLSRAGMTPARLAAILSRQASDASKQRRADFVVSTGLDRRMSAQALHRIVTLALHGHGWRRKLPRGHSDHA
jgi:dephospho-CoA kinase